MIAEKKYLQPHTIADALLFAQQNVDSFSYLAGGTDIIVNKFQGNNVSTCLIDISQIAELKNIVIDGNCLKIGSLVRLDDLKKNAHILERYPALIHSANAVASPMLRKTATIGGNILCENRCMFYNQSDWWREAVGYCLKCDGDICIATGGKKACFSKFVSDTAPVLISMDAYIEVLDWNSSTIEPLESIYTGDGITPLALPATSLIGAILLPLDHPITIFKKLRPREAVDFTSLTTAVSLYESGRLKVVLGGVDPKPIVIQGTINDDFEELIKNALKKSRTVDNDYYSRAYRREMIKVFLQQSFTELSLRP
ncbi:MAG: FAD binding domain-containing protein [Bacteroidota bacterium]